MTDPWEAQREALGAFIREQRKRANLSLRQLAELTSLSNPYLSQVERGLHQPSVRVLKALSGALNVSAETLLAQAGLIDAMTAGANGATDTQEPNVPGTEHAMKADLVLLAMGFLGPRREGLLSDLGVRLTDRGNVWRDRNWMTSVPGVFAAGDIQRGQSLIVWAIAEGRSAARGVDLYLMGSSDLPAPLP